MMGQSNIAAGYNHWFKNKAAAPMARSYGTQVLAKASALVKTHSKICEFRHSQCDSRVSWIYLSPFHSYIMVAKDKLTIMPGYWFLYNNACAGAQLMEICWQGQTCWKDTAPRIRLPRRCHQWRFAAMQLIETAVGTIPMHTKSKTSGR